MSAPAVFIPRGFSKESNLQPGIDISYCDASVLEIAGVHDIRETIFAP